MEWNFKAHQNRIAVITESGEKISYAQLSSDGDVLCNNIPGRCLVFCMCSNTYPSLLGYVSFLRARIVPVMVEATLDPELLSELISKYSPSYIWAPDTVDSPDVKAGQAVYSFRGYNLYKMNKEIVYPLYSELALLLTTSGSTGSPKLVRQSYANILANTRSIIEYLEINENEVTITTLPMNYTYGLSIINTHLYAGASVVLTDKTLMHKEFWTLFKENNITSFGGVPYIYQMLERLRFRQMDLPSLKTMTQAGGRLSPELHLKYAEYAQKTGKRFFAMYGQTEATARMSYLPFSKSAEKYGSVGIAIPGGEFSLIDVNGNIITEPEVPGELVFKGENVTLGYAECGEHLIRGDERGSVLRTGDIAKRDADGYYYIVGRLKRFLKLFGSRVNLDEMETIINEHFPDIGCVCGGVDDKLFLFVENDGHNEDLLHFLCEKTSLTRSAFKIKKIDKIPRNESGKVKYTELEKYYHE